MATTNTAGNPFLERVYAAKSVEDCRDLYDSWAATFENDVNHPSQDYVAPTIIVRAIVEAKGNLDGLILDAGCGTGLVGKALKEAGAAKIDGTDLSPGMLKVAQEAGCYRQLDVVDLSLPMPTKDGTYDIVTCVGTLTHGHVGPTPALQEFVRVTKSLGIVALTVLDDIWSSGGYKQEIEKIQAEGLIRIVSNDSMDYRRGAGVKARVVLFKKT